MSSSYSMLKLTAKQTIKMVTMCFSQHHASAIASLSYGAQGLTSGCKLHSQECELTREILKGYSPSRGEIAVDIRLNVN